jgi:hypothetical protein
MSRLLTQHDECWRWWDRSRLAIIGGRASLTPNRSTTARLPEVADQCHLIQICTQKGHRGRNELESSCLLLLFCCLCSGHVVRWWSDGDTRPERRWCHDAPLLRARHAAGDFGSRSSGNGSGRPVYLPGDLFDHAGGRKVGHTAGQCTTFSGNATATGDVFCTGTFVLDRGQITVQCLLDSAALFGRGETLPCGIMGGAVIYRNARGDGTVQVPVNVPNQTHANFVLNVVTG